ncbi:MAG: thioredoxin family protein [Eggerthella lenta]
MVELTKENFDAWVTNAEGTVLVDFWSQVAVVSSHGARAGSQAARHPEVRFAKLNAADSRHRLGLQSGSVPTLVLFRDRVPERHRRR